MRLPSTKALALVLLVVAIYVGSTAWNVATRINTQTKTTASLSNVIEALEVNCHRERPRTRQIKFRGEAELALLELFLTLAREDSSATSQEFVRRFEPLTRKIHIIPLPDCTAEAEDLRAELPPG